MTHTPGPWQLGAPSPDVNAAATVRSDGWDVAHCFGTNAEPNARLIAAAPDLLAACQAVIHATSDPTRWAQQVIDAIAKAEGDTK